MHVNESKASAPFNAATLIFNCDSIFAFSHSDSVTQSEVIYLVIGWLVINLFFKTWSSWHFSGNHEQWVKCAGFLDNKLWMVAPLYSWRKNKDLEKALKKKNAVFKTCRTCSWMWFTIVCQTTAGGEKSDLSAFLCGIDILKYIASNSREMLPWPRRTWPSFFVAVWRKISHGRLRGLNDKGVTFHPQKVNFSHDYRDVMPKSLALLCFL